MSSMMRWRQLLDQSYLSNDADEQLVNIEVYGCRDLDILTRVHHSCWPTLWTWYKHRYWFNRCNILVLLQCPRSSQTWCNVFVAVAERRFMSTRFKVSMTKDCCMSLVLKWRRKRLTAEIKTTFYTSLSFSVSCYWMFFRVTFHEARILKWRSSYFLERFTATDSNEECDTT